MTSGGAGREINPCDVGFLGVLVIFRRKKGDKKGTFHAVTFFDSLLLIKWSEVIRDLNPECNMFETCARNY